jgi:hypothetical protein
VSDIRYPTTQDLQWAFRDGNPRYSYSERGGGSCEVDPMPCYAHDATIAVPAISTIELIWKPETPVVWHLAAFEDTGRTNAFAQKLEDYYEEYGDGRKWTSHIFLSGKRTPINPAVTEYVVAHEYGHHVDYWIANRSYPDIERDYERDTEFQKAYAVLRGCDYSKKYGAGNWHNSIGEIIANDFRILIAGVQTNYWPHDIEHPFKVKDLDNWWSDQLKTRRNLDA